MTKTDGEAECEFRLGIVTEISEAFDDLPILSRLEFAKNVMFSRDGDKTAVPVDPVSMIVTEVLSGVIDILKKHPAAAKLRGLDL